MNVWAIVPVKPLNRAKSRLAGVLTPERREELSSAMLRHTVAVLAQSQVISGVLVISRDNRALVIARKYGAKTVQESGAPALNQALERVTRMIASWNAQAALILPADIPLLMPEDLNELTDLGRFHQSVVLVPDRQEDGTNALLMRPPTMFSCQFGENSFQRHAAAAAEAHAEIHVFRSERLMLDVDTPEDVLLYLELCKKYQVNPLVDLTWEELQPFYAKSQQKEKNPDG